MKQKSQRLGISVLSGFTLIETLLVLVIISIIIYASIGYMQQRATQMRFDRTSTQMQQILNAGLSYYVANGNWPTSLTELQNKGFLPKINMTNPWGNPYTVAVPNNNLFYVYTEINVVTGKNGGAYAATTAISGTLPLAYTSNSAGNPPDASKPCGATDAVCYVAAAVNIPGQNVNNATSVNYAGLYHPGACVQVPQCPVDTTGATMTPQIYVSPVQVSGTTDANNPNDAYPITSFTAYATGGIGGSATPDACGKAAINNVQTGLYYQSPSTSIGMPCGGTDTRYNTGTPSGKYWRVCLNLVGQNQVAKGNAWGQKQTLLAITRCVITNETKTGSTFSVFGN